MIIEELSFPIHLSWVRFVFYKEFAPIFEFLRHSMDTYDILADNAVFNSEKMCRVSKLV